ncbi:MAG: tyrosine-type recombinase/integrase, partial [Terracidiphilus sp.]
MDEIISAPTPVFLLPRTVQPSGPASVASLRTMVTNSVPSGHTRRAYAKAFDDLLALAMRTGQPISRQLFQQYRAEMVDAGLGGSTINVRLSGVRKLVTEARENGLVDPSAAGRILSVPNVPAQGVRLGQWLTVEQSRELLAVPDQSRLKGKRDHAILSVLIQTALRREEAAHLDMHHIQMRDGRWVLADIRGKRGRVRTVALPAGAKAAIDAWTGAAGITSGPVFRRLTRSGRILPGEGLGVWAIWNVVVTSAKAIGIDGFGPHDARRTCAKLCRKQGGELEQIQFMLGHDSVATTAIYTFMG